MERVEVNYMFKEVIDIYTNEKYANGLSDSTLKIIDTVLKDFMKNLELCDSDYISIISKRMIDKYIVIMKQKGYSLAHINMNICHLRVFIYWCQKEKFIEEFKINTVKGQLEEPKQIKDDDIKKLLTKPSKNCYYWESRAYAIVVFLLSTGCRASTLINIKNEDVDYRNKTIYYRYLKNKKYTTIPMSNTLSRTLLGFQKEWNICQYEYLFPNKTGQQMTLGALEKTLAQWCKKCGTQRYGPHSFRRYFARQYVKKGGSVFALQQFLTHSSLEMTRHYCNLNTEDLRINLDNYLSI